MAASKTHAVNDLNQVFQIISEVMHSAWEEYQAYPIALRVNHSTRSRATLVHDFMRRLAQEKFEGKKGIKLLERRGLLLVNLFEKYLLRFKKLSRSGKPQSIPTNQTNLFNGQEMELPYMPEKPTCVVAGYQLDALQQEIETCRILCPDGRHIRWEIPLESALEQSLQDVIKFTPTKTKIGRKVKPKKALPQAENK